MSLPWVVCAAGVVVCVWSVLGVVQRGVHVAGAGAACSVPRGRVRTADATETGIEGFTKLM